MVCPSEILCDVWGRLQTSLWQLPLLPLPQEEECTRGSGPRASPSWRLSAVTSLLHLHQAPKPRSPAGDPLAYKTGTLDIFFHLENDIWPGRRCVKIGYVNLTATCNILWNKRWQRGVHCDLRSQRLHPRHLTFLDPAVESILLLWENRFFCPWNHCDGPDQGWRPS